jgi:hypothetical protein
MVNQPHLRGPGRPGLGHTLTGQGAECTLAEVGVWWTCPYPLPHYLHYLSQVSEKNRPLYEQIHI